MKTEIKLEIDSMTLLERRINSLEKRIADLEAQAQSQQKNKIDADIVVNKQRIN